MKTETHEQFPKGTIIKKKGEHGEFVVQYVTTFEDSRRLAEVSVVGGANGRRAWRTFLITTVRAKPQRRRRIG